VSQPAPRAPAVATRQAELSALRVAQEAAAHVPAYARFLRLAGYDVSRLRSFADFCQLPVADKASYLARYPLIDRCRDRELARAHIITLSSGSAGPATLWPRFPEQDEALWLGITTVLQEHFHIRERWTLVVMAQAVGAWGFATSMIQVCQRLFSQPGMRGTVVTPGLNQEEVLRFIEQLAPHYDQTILVSYPAVIPGLIERGVREGISWPELNVNVLVGGETFSDGLRERVLGRIGKDPERLEGFVSQFGASEVAGIVGYETHLCLLIRRLCIRTPALTEALFGSPVLPSLNQYNPLRSFLQLENGEVTLTIRGAVPLIRYNTHDRGGLLTLKDVEARCRAHGYDLLAELQARGFGPNAYRPLPFLYVFGRSDAVIVHGGNVYRDDVAYVLDQRDLLASNSGNFDLSVETDADGRTVLRAQVELGAGVEATAALRSQYQQRLIQGLQQVNSIFRAVYTASEGQIAVEVELVPFGMMVLRGPKRERRVLPQNGEGSASAPSGTLSGE
jgi:phenylacetate-CoA ligase